MWFLALLCLLGFVPAGGLFLKWLVHITHTWFPLVPEIPYGTACMTVFAMAVTGVVMAVLGISALRVFAG